MVSKQNMQLDWQRPETYLKKTHTKNQAYQYIVVYATNLNWLGGFQSTTVNRFLLGFAENVIGDQNNEPQVIDGASFIWDTPSELGKLQK